MTTDEHYFPSLANVSIKFFFPPEVNDVSLISEQGIFSMDNSEGEWTFDPLTLMKSDQDNICERV
jgi:hypothetical protein